MGFGGDSGFDNDVNNEEFDSVELSVTSSSEVEATTGNLTFRQWVRIYNNGPGKVLVGPQGKPKEVLFKNQGITFNHGPDNPVYVIAENATTNVLVMESG